MTKPQFKKFGFVVKQNVPEAINIAVDAHKWLAEKGFTAAASDDATDLLAAVNGMPAKTRDDLVKWCDVVLVFGGDGTFLSIARHMHDVSRPIMGVNLGRLGFLTEVPVDKVESALDNLTKGDFEIQSRAMLEAVVCRDKKVEYARQVLNDAVITNADIARVLDLELAIDGVHVATIKADGLILSTPTGSTAYSLAAGGPIVHPDVSATTITAICPHSLTIRPIVVPDTAEIVIKTLKRRGGALLTLDGQSGFDLLPGDVVKVRRFTKHKLQVLHPVKRDYFELLRNKLKLGVRAEGTH